jgi:3-oxoacyl-[acyl-carrier protein] reductase
MHLDADRAADSDRRASRVVLVTGAARGIGAAIARRFAADGARVVLHDRDADELDEVAAATPGARPLTLVGDLSEPAVAERLIADVVERHGRLDGLIGNAGTGWRATLEQHPLDAWERVIAVNLRAPFLLARAAQSHLAATRGSIVMTASVAATGLGGQAAYDASKGGLISLTRALAVELGPLGVRVNAVCPGFVETRLGEHPAIREQVASVVATQPIKRLGRVDEIAAVVAYLASDRASYVTGQALHVDGGWVRR